MPSVTGKTVSLSRVPYSTYQQRRPTPQEASSMAQKKAAAEAAAAKAKSKMLVSFYMLPETSSLVSLIFLFFL